MACPAVAGKAELSFVRNTVEVSDSVLSKQVTPRADAGYVRARKGYTGKRPRTWRSLTAEGRRAFDGHLAARTAIAARPARPEADVSRPRRHSAAGWPATRPGAGSSWSGPGCSTTST